MTTAIRGEKHQLAKLTTPIVIEMRRARKERRLPYAQLGDLYGVSAQVAHGICRGTRWPHVGGPIARPSKPGRRPKDKIKKKVSKKTKAKVTKKTKQKAKVREQRAA